MNRANTLVWLQAQISPTGLPNPSFSNTAVSILQIVSMAATILAVIFIAVGGIKYTLSNGDPQGINQAKNTIISAIVGMVLALFAFTIISFVAGRLAPSI